MAKLADALGLGPSGRKVVGVQILLPAQPTLMVPIIVFKNVV